MQSHCSVYLGEYFFSLNHVNIIKKIHNVIAYYGKV